MALMASVVSARAADAQVLTGTTNLHLGPPGGTTLISTTALLASTSAGVSRTVVQGGGTGPFAVPDLPVADDYGVDVRSRTDSGLTCVGSTAPFPVQAGTTTILFVSLACAPAVPALDPAHALSLAVLLALLSLMAIAPRRRLPGAC